MEVQNSAYSKYEWQLEAIAALRRINLVANNSVFLSLIVSAEKTLQLNSDATAAIALAANYYLSNIAVPIGAIQIADVWQGYAFVGFDGRVRLGVLIDLIESSL